MFHPKHFGSFSKAARAPSQYKDRLYQVWDSRLEVKTVARPSYLLHGDTYTGKTTSLYWDSPQGGIRNRGSTSNISKHVLLYNTDFCIRMLVPCSFDQNALGYRSIPLGPRLGFIIYTPISHCYMEGPARHHRSMDNPCSTMMTP